MKMRLLKTGTNDAFMNMAIDEALMDSELPTLRLYSWSPPAVSIGYFQKVEEEVDERTCRELGIDIVRRQTGGGAVYHDKEVTYSVVLREYPLNIMESYTLICGSVVAGLRSAGISAEFSPLNDIVVNGRKVSGSAQTRRKGVLLQHGTLLLDVDVDRMFTVLKVPNEKLKGKLISEVKARVAPLGIGFEDACKAVQKGFELKMGAELVPDTLSKAEVEKARRIAEEKYGNGEWLYRI